MDLLLPLSVLAVAVPLSRARPGAAVLLVNGLCALGLADTATPANAHVLSLAVVSCLLGGRVARARGPLLVLASCLAVDMTACAVLQVPAVWWFYAMAVLPTALLLPWLAGRHWRGRRELVREGWRLARSLEERQHLVAERARLTERADPDPSDPPPAPLRPPAPPSRPPNGTRRYGAPHTAGRSRPSRRRSSRRRSSYRLPSTWPGS
ncbi:hypothetical protein [Streptomyces vinaceus]|uniref:hypothetical protein n=1 Tax=Streptomyces vinaceus TaxID=1960 RepID=UPI0035E0C382